MQERTAEWPGNSWPDREESTELSMDELEIRLRAASGKKRKAYWRVKRTMDAALSAAALVVLSPLLLVLAIAIYIDDPHGSPLYSQERVGRHGKRFRFWKFRSMVVGADQMMDKLMAYNEKDGPVFKMKDDPRITRVGHFIRRTSLDELPQLWNVLKGDMSLVGPRPALPSEAQKYGRYENYRLMVTPGLTCYWQCMKHRDQISFQEWMELDMKYILERSLWVDLKILLRTVRVVLGGDGE